MVVQELQSQRYLPGSVRVTLEHDLVESCNTGDHVTVIGTFERRWSPLVAGTRTEVHLALRANSVTRHDHFSRRYSGGQRGERSLTQRPSWEQTVKEIGEAGARDMLVQSIAPDIVGMYPAKLAVALTLASGTDRALDEGPSVRSTSHLLLVGDSGVAKSRLMQFAAKISSRAICTTGMGCSAAGLTAAAVKEDDDWQLEAGALVLADGGLCCIDEFGSMSSSDQASIHEAMEQQTISIAKAGITCKLSTRCNVMAATDPAALPKLKCDNTSKAGSSKKKDTSTGTPLLSRFDLVLMLKDPHCLEWDEEVANALLAEVVVDEARHEFESDPVDREHWQIERLQDHFFAIKGLKSKIPADANAIIAKYYSLCRQDEKREPCRTSIRLLESLARLAEAHARLMFRDQVTVADGGVVRLMESSWGFGRLQIDQFDLMRGPLPLGPTRQQVAQLIGELDLHRTVTVVDLIETDVDKVRRYKQRLAEERLLAAQPIERSSSYGSQ